MVSMFASSKNISEGYEQRVAVPLAVLAALCLIFILVSDHRDTVSLKNTSGASTSKSLVKPESAPKVNVVNDAQTLNSTVETEDLSPNESPMTISTASPQTGSSGTSSSTSSGSALQAASSASPSTSSSGSGVSSSPISTSQPSAAEIENIINGTTNAVTNITTKTTKGTIDLLNAL